MLWVGRLPKLLPAAVTMKTPCSYSAFTASAHACEARPPMLMVMMSIAVGAGRVQPMHIIERLGDRAVVEQHDAVGDPNRHDFGERRAAEQRLSRLARCRPGC